MSDHARVRATIHVNEEYGHALLGMTLFEGKHGYLTVTGAITLTALQELWADIAVVIGQLVEAENAARGPLPDEPRDDEDHEDERPFPARGDGQ